MLRPRVTVFLMLKNKSLIKTVKFGEHKYIGDPINAVRLFNEKQVDEIVIADAFCTAECREPDYKLIHDLASECRMPFCYAGGVKSLYQVEKIIGLGVEKVAIGHSAIHEPSLISEAAKRVGSQSVVAVLDVKKHKLPSKYIVYTKNGKSCSNREVSSVAADVETAGAGEIIINSIDRDGTLSGYDFELVARVKESVSIPISVVGGSSSLNDMGQLFKRFGIVGAVGGSMFVFKGKYRAVLIQYPSLAEKAELTDHL